MTEGTPRIEIPTTEKGIDFGTYHSPFELRYSGEPMRSIWSEDHKARLMRDVWVAVALAQNRAGIVSDKEYQDLLSQKDDVDFATILRRETNQNDPNYTGHDVLAAISEFADKAKVGGGKIHQGMTSEDVLSNVEVMQMDESLILIEDGLINVLEGFVERIEEFKELPILGFTHIQAGEPITLGLRLANYAQNFLIDLANVRRIKQGLKGKGIKGPVGTSAGIEKLLEGTDMSVEEHEQIVMEQLGLEAFTITSQTYPRKQFAEVIKVMSGLGTSSFNFGMNMRLLQSSPFDELSEPRRENDRSSSSMPHKRNPRHAENIMGLSRGLKYKSAEAEEIASSVPLERGIDDSSGKRTLLPEAFLAIDEVLGRCDRIIRGFDVHEDSIWRNLEQFAPYTATEQILSLTSKEGANRQEMHEILSRLATKAMEVARRTGENPLKDLVAGQEAITKFVDPERIAKEFEEAIHHTGNAKRMCMIFLQEELYPAIEQTS